MLRKFGAALVVALALFALPAVAGDNLPATTVPTTVFSPPGATSPNQSGYYAARNPDVFTQVNAVTITSATTLWTPSNASVRFRLMGWCLTQTTATGNVTLQDNGVAFMIIPANTLGQQQCYTLPGNGYLSTGPNQLLKAIGVSTEVISGTLIGDEE